MKIMEKQANIQVGNAAIDAHRGWFVGNFIDAKLGLRHSGDVEIKWGVHSAGEERPEWATSETRTSIGILVSGRFEMMFRDRTALLAKPGDYVMWGKGTDHKWRILANDTVVITIRWPST